MATGATGQLGLALPVQGELTGTWGNTVNNAITEYTNIAIAATLTLTNDGAVTLANTTGTDLATNITSTLTGAGTVTAQFAIVKVTGTLTTAKVVTAPSYSKTYTVVNAATGGIVTFKASGQTGVSIAVGESAFVYFNGTDYVKVAGTSAVSSFSAGTTGLTPSTATTGAITLAGTLAVANGGTGVTTSTGSGNTVLSTSPTLVTPVLGTPTSVTLTNATGLPLTTGVTGVLPVANGGTNASTASITSFNNITGYTASGATGTTSTNLVFSTSPTLVTPVLGTPTSGTLSNCTVDGTYSVGFRKIPPVGAQTSSYTLAIGDVGKFVEVQTGGSIVIPAATYSAGDAITIFNNTSGNITITCSAVNAYLAGTNSLKTSVTVATRGVSNILFYSASDCVITGNVS